LKIKPKLLSTWTWQEMGISRYIKKGTRGMAVLSRTRNNSSLPYNPIPALMTLLLESR